MTNSIYYIIICIISTSLLAYSLYKKRDIKLISLYFFLSGLIYLFEFVIFVLLNSYTYHPNILKNEYFDGILGSVASNAFSVPMTATFIATFNKGFKVKTIAALSIILVEFIFLKLEIYTHNWWRISYTLVGIYLIFWISKLWYKALKENFNKLYHFINFHLIVVAIQSTLSFIISAIFNGFRFEIGWFDNPTRDSVAFSTAYIILFSILYTLVIIYDLRLIIKIIPIAFLSLADLVLFNLGILKFSSGWNFYNFMTMRFALLIFLIFLNKVLFKKTWSIQGILSKK